HGPADVCAHEEVEIRIGAVRNGLFDELRYVRLRHHDFDSFVLGGSGRPVMDRMVFWCSRTSHPVNPRHMRSSPQPTAKAVAMGRHLLASASAAACTGRVILASACDTAAARWGAAESMAPLRFDWNGAPTSCSRRAAISCNVVAPSVSFMVSLSCVRALSPAA